MPIDIEKCEPDINTPVVVTDVPATTVASLLKDSRKAHQAYRSAAGRTNAEGTVTHTPHDGLKTAAIQLAFDKRLAAFRLDPTRSDPEWQNDPAPHEVLMSFYTNYLSV